MKDRSQPNRRFVLLALLIGAISGGVACGDGAGTSTPPEILEVRRGPLVQRHYLTGELEAVESAKVIVPRTNEWQLQVQWLIPDGSIVTEGQTVVEFDNSSFTANLDQQRTGVQLSFRTVLQNRADGDARLREAEAVVERSRIALAKALIDASVPESIRSRYDHESFQLLVVKARANHDKALADLRATTDSVEADNLVAEEQLRKIQRELEVAEKAVDAVVLKAPRDGLVVIEEHNWEDRKYQVGDNLFADWVVLGIPDLDRLRVQASLSDVDDGSLEVGMPVTCIPDIDPEHSIDGRVTTITPIARERRIFTQRRGFDVTVELHGSFEDTQLVPGMSVRIEVATTQPESLLIPRAALDLGPEGPRALDASGDWTAVQIGACSANDCVVISGLDEGARLRPVGEES